MKRLMWISPNSFIYVSSNYNSRYLIHLHIQKHVSLSFITLHKGTKRKNTHLNLKFTFHYVHEHDIKSTYFFLSPKKMSLSEVKKRQSCFKIPIWFAFYTIHLEKLNSQGKKTFKIHFLSHQFHQTTGNTLICCHQSSFYRAKEIKIGKNITPPSWKYVFGFSIMIRNDIRLRLLA